MIEQGKQPPINSDSETAASVQQNDIKEESSTSYSRNYSGEVSSDISSDEAEQQPQQQPQHRPLRSSRGTPINYSLFNSSGKKE